MALPIACPAASPTDPLSHGPSVICGVLELSNEGAHVNGFTSHGQVSALMSGLKDAKTVAGFCCRFGTGERGGYVRCAIWRAQREAEWAARKGPDALRDDAATRPPVTRELVGG